MTESPDLWEIFKIFSTLCCKVFRNLYIFAVQKIDINLEQKDKLLMLNKVNILSVAKVSPFPEGRDLGKG